MKYNNKVILTDCDGCTLDWETAFHSWMRDKGHDKMDVDTYDMHVIYPDLQRKEAKQLIKNFNESAWMCCLPAFRDARSGVARLTEAGYVFDVITSLSTDPYAGKLRQENLETHFSAAPWNSLTCLETGADKDAALEPYRDTGLYWIEDKWENAVLGADLGLKSIIINHPHNQHRHDDRIIRVNTWNEIADLIIKDISNDTA